MRLPVKRAVLYLVVVAMVTGGQLASPSSAAQRSPDVLPSIQQDDAARLVRAADFRETEDLVSGFGAIFGPADYAASLGAETIVGGPFDGLDLDGRVDLLDDLGWLSVAQLNIGVANQEGDDFTAQLLTSITRFQSPEAAEEAFEVLEDESDDPAAEDEEAPSTFGSTAEITVSDGEALYRNLTFVVDDTHVNAFVIGPEDDPVLTDELMLEAGELVAERLLLDVDELPGLAPLILRVASDGESTFSYEEEYQSLDGDTPRDSYDTDEEYDLRAEQWRDLDHVYSYLGGFAPDGTIVTRLHRARDTEAAGDLMEALEENPAPGFYDSWELVDGGPELGDATLTARFTYSLGEDEYQGYAVVFQVEDVVARVEVDAVDDLGLDLAVELAEAQLECLQDGACEPIELPVDVIDDSADDEPSDDEDDDVLGPDDDDEQSATISGGQSAVSPRRSIA